MKYYLIILLFSISTSSVGQASKNNAPCNCLNLFDELIEKIKENYIAYHIEIKGKRDVEYQNYIKKYRKKAKNTATNKCVKLLKEFITFYRDGHLYIGQSPKLTDEEIKNLQVNAEKIVRSETDIRQYLDKNVKKLDLIEGTWYSKENKRFAIFRDKKSKYRDYVAISLNENDGLWEIGHVKAEFNKLSDGSYDIVLYDDNHYPIFPGGYKRDQKGGAKIQRNHILHMPPISWGKEFPLDKNPLIFVDSSDPRCPTMKIIDASTVLFSIPSHDPVYAPRLKEFIDKNHDRIIQVDNLIIDLRGNEGGSSWVTNVLMPYIETSSKLPPKYWINDQDFVLSSPRNIKYFKGIENQGWLSKNLIKRLEENLGKLIPFNDPIASDSSSNISEILTEKTKESSKPKNVAILINDEVVSAGEAFIIKAMKYKKVTLFGENTAGVIDYRSTYWISLSNCPSEGLYLGYPMFAASDRLPEGGVNKTGIEPDVRISKNETTPIQFIIDYFNNKKNKNEFTR